MVRPIVRRLPRDVNFDGNSDDIIASIDDCVDSALNVLA